LPEGLFPENSGVRLAEVRSRAESRWLKECSCGQATRRGSGGGYFRK